MKAYITLIMIFVNFMNAESIVPAKTSKIDITSALYSLSIKMSSHQIMDLIIDNAYNESNYFNDKYGISSPSISLQTVKEMLKSEPLSAFDDAFRDLGISYADFRNAYLSYNPSYKLLQHLGVSFSDTVNNFLQHIKYNNEIFLKVLNLIYIDPDTFQQTLWYGNEEKLFNLFSNGTYEEDDLKNVVKLTNMKVSFSNLANLIKYGSDFIDKLSMHLEDNFIELMKKLNVDRDDLKTAFRNFNVLEATELLSVNPMPLVLADLKTVNSIATQISEYKVITHKDASILQKFKELAPSATIIGENLADDREIEFILNSIYPTDSNYAILWTQDSMGTIYATVDTTESGQSDPENTNCAYWYVDENYVTQVGTTPIWEKDAFIVRKQNVNQIFPDGTPLFCNDKLYALSINDSSETNDVMFMSKYPIVKELVESFEVNQSLSFFGDTFGKFMTTFSNLKDLIVTSYQVIKILLSHWQIF